MSCGFQVGKDVVALRNSPYGDYKKDDVFPLIGIKISECKCNTLDLNIGQTFDNDNENLYCDVCNTSYHENSAIWWKDSIDFAPLDSLTNIDELTEILEQPLFEVK